jgi:CO/xanthine dehydrogenase Mo-binding subunit
MLVRIGLQHRSAEGRRRPLACQAIAATLTPVEKLVGLTGADTGRVDVLGHLVVQDVGRAISPAAVEGRMHGAVVQGLGWALLERMPYDARGQLMAATPVGGVPAAVANAVAYATGARLTDLPITGEAIRAARRSGPLP